MKKKENPDTRLSNGQSREIRLRDGNLLTREEQLKVIQWFVELKPPIEIVELIKEEFGKTITRQSIYEYAHTKKWKPIIARLRAQFEKNILRIPIANKAHRLRYLQAVVKEGMKWSLKTITKDGDEIYELKLSAVTEAIKAAKEELEPHQRGAIIVGEGGKIIFQDIKIEQLAAPELLRDINSRLNLQFVEKNG